MRTSLRERFMLGLGENDCKEFIRYIQHGFDIGRDSKCKWISSRNEHKIPH